MLYKDKEILEIDTYYFDEIQFMEDCKKIQQAFFNHAIMLTLLECQEIYSNYSDMFCASWECGIEDYNEEYIFNLLLPYLKELLEDKTNRIIKVYEMLVQNGYYKEKL